jgi:hypothetical protein
METTSQSFPQKKPKQNKQRSKEIRVLILESLSSYLSSKTTTLDDEADEGNWQE